ncbi:unnamed protein product [Ectocarpus sp. 13 AM-2016]
MWAFHRNESAECAAELFDPPPRLRLRSTGSWVGWGVHLKPFLHRGGRWWQREQQQWCRRGGPGVTTMTTTTLLDDPDLQYSSPVVLTGGVLRPTPQEHFVVGGGGGPRRRQQWRATRIHGRRLASSSMLGTTSSSQQGEDGKGGGHRLRSVLLDTPWPFSAAGERWWWCPRGRRHGLHGRHQRKLDHRRPVRAGLPEESRRRANVTTPATGFYRSRGDTWCA